MDYPRELKKHLAKKMAKVDAECMNTSFQEAYEYHLASESFDLLEYWMSYFGIFDEETNLLQGIHPNNILNIKK